MRSALSKWVVILVSLLAAASFGSAQRFQNPPYIPIANGYYQVLSGDLHGNGRQDLVYWSQAGNQAWYDVYRNDGGRQFTDMGQVSLGSPLFSQALLLDINGDGKLDLVFVSWYGISGYEVLFLAGNGDGTFAAAVTSQISGSSYFAPETPLQMYAANLTGSGHLDLAVSSQYEGGSPIDVLAGDGTGRFTLETQLTNQPVALSQRLNGAVDLNGDGLADLVLWNFRQTNAIQVYINQGGGQFQWATAYTLPASAAAISEAVFADINGDGIPDLICNDGISLYLAIGKGDGTFTQTAQTPFLTDGWLLGIQDMNGDGRPDLIVQENEGISILLKGTDFSYTALPVALTGDEYRSAVIADIDGDGNPDVLTSINWPDGTEGISMLWGSSGGVLASAYGYRSPYFLQGAAMAHFASGPAPDIAVQPAYAELPLTFRNNGDGTFKLLPDPNPSVPPSNQPPANIYWYALQAGDYNGDGLPDLLESGEFGTNIGGDVGGPWLVQSLAGKGNGSFGAAAQALDYLSNSDPYNAVTAGDLNGDGIDDIAVAYNGTVDILLGQKGGGWKLSQSIQAANSSWTQVVFGDWNGDGIADLAIQNATEVRFYLGSGDGTFTAGQSVTLPFDASNYYITAGDVDGDGNADLLVTTYNGLYPLYGNGDGSFQPGQQIALSGSGNVTLGVAAQIADVNRDGWPDLVIIVPNGLVVRHGQGNRAWDAGDTYVSGYIVEPVSVDQVGIQTGFGVQDLNQDGFPDIALLNNDGSYVNSNIVSVLLNIPASDDLTGTLTISPEPQQQGASATATVTVKSALAGGAMPTGSISLTVDGVEAGSGTLSGGQLQLPLEGAPALASGHHFVVAVYGGDGTYHAARFTAVHRVLGQVQPSTQTTLTAQPNPVAEGSPLQLTATVSSAGGTPSGTVDFVEGTSVLGQGTLNASGIASLTLSTLAPGQHVLVAKYAGAGQFPASTSAPVTVTVLTIPTTTALKASATALTVGQQLTLTATVKATTGGTPAGTVSFNNGPDSLGSATLNANGIATLTLTPAAGTYTVTATYGGSATDASSTSSPVVVQVTAAPLAATTTVLTSSANPSPVGSSVTFTATVKSNVQTQTPTGSVTFYDGTASLAKVALASGSAAFQTSGLSAGTHNIQAVYSGDSLFLASTSNTIQEVIADAADFSITATPASRSVYTGETATYTVSLQQAAIPVVQSGAGFTLPVKLSCSGLPAGTTCYFSPATIPSETGMSALTVKTTAPSGTNTTAASTARYGAALASLALLLLPWRKRWRWLMLFVVAATAALAASAISGCGGGGTLHGGTPTGSYTITVTGTAKDGAQTLQHSVQLQLDVKSLF